MIDLAPEHLRAVQAIFKKHVPECELRVFGSRIQGTSRPFSDLDVALVGVQKLEFDVMEKLRDDFAESNLPIKVDVHDWHTLSKDFQRLIQNKYEIFPVSK